MIDRVKVYDDWTPPPRRRPFDVSWFELAVIAGISAAVFALIFFGTYDSGRSRIDGTCIGKLHAIRMALRMYQHDYGTLPPAIVDDAQGRPAHSSRVLILPYLGRTDLYRRYWFSEPWDSEHNLALAREIPGEYRCRADDPVSECDTSYLAVTGDGTLWPQRSGPRVADTDERVAIVEVWRSGIAWTEPRDLPLAAIETPGDEPSPSIVTRHSRPSRFASLGHLLLLNDDECAGCTHLLRELATDGAALARIRGQVHN